jgi:hypothetical protein
MADVALLGFGLDLMRSIKKPGIKKKSLLGERF